MKKSKFDEFINEYDGKTKGRYTYYYKYLWNACYQAEQNYQAKHKSSIWENGAYKGEWVRSFKESVNGYKLPEDLKQSLGVALESWLETV